MRADSFASSNQPVPRLAPRPARPGIPENCFTFSGRPVAEPGPNGFVAHQRPIQVGELVGNDYVILGGLKPGDKVITAGIQKIGDGAPVRAEESAPNAPPTPQL